MSWQDIYDDFEPPMEVDRVAPTRVGSMAQPTNLVALNPGRAPFETPVDVHRDMVIDMRDILTIPKSIHLQGTPRYKTANMVEVRKLIDACFSINVESWKTGDLHSLPSTKEIDGGVDSVNIVVGTFLMAMGAVTKVKGYDKKARKEIINRQVNGGEKLMKVMKEEQRPIS